MIAPFDTTPPPRDVPLREVLERAAIDPAFRRRLLDDPRAAIRDTFGVQIPEGFRFRFVERAADVQARTVLVVRPSATRPAVVAPPAGASGRSVGLERPLERQVDRQIERPVTAAARSARVRRPGRR